MQNIEQLYKEYFETVNKYLVCLSHNNELSLELTQETFCKAVQQIDKFQGNCKVEVWLCQIAKNLYFNYSKKMKKVTFIEDLTENLIPQATNSPENEIILKEEKMTLYQKLHKLDEKTREVMYLRITGELSFREIGTILNKTETWARVTFYRGKEKLKEVDKNE